MKKHLLRGLLAAAVCLAVLTPALAPSARAEEYTAEEREFIENSGPLKVGYVSARPPVSFEDGNGQLAGISRYIFDRVAKLSGLEFQFVPLPDGDVTYDYLTSEGFALVTSVEQNRENQQARGILVSDPYLASRKVVVGRQDLDFRLDSRLSVAITTGSQTIKKVLGDMYPNFTLVDYDSISDCLDAVKAGRADLMIQNQYVVEYWLSKPKYEGLKVVPVVGTDEELCFSAVVDFGTGVGAPQEDGELVISIINKAIGRISQEEISNYTIQGIMENQYRQTLADFVYRYRALIVVLAVSALVIIALGILLFNARVRSMEARADAKARGQFLSTMSHEIRTPLNGLMGLNYLMSQKTDDPEKISGYLRQSTATARYLLSLVDDLLDMSRIREHRTEILAEPTDMELLVTGAANLARGVLEDKGIEFVTDIAIGTPWVEADPVRVEQILMHLLDNAGKFTPEGGKVTLRVWQGTRDDGRVITAMEVTDNGRGMSEEFQKHVFDAFARELDTVSKGNEGTGLGLAISHELALAMGGELSVESHKGLGSRFLFVFPAPIAQPPEPQEPEPPKAPGRTRILVAEDNELNREIMHDLLENEGFDILMAMDGREAVELFRSSPVGDIGLILMDLLMPVMDGYEAARAIRELNRPDAATVRIIACTANTQESDRRRAFEAGMDDFIPKPVDVSDLLNKIGS